MIKTADNAQAQIQDVIYRRADIIARDYILRALQNQDQQTMLDLIEGAKKNGYDITPAIVRKTAGFFLRCGIIKAHIKDGRQVFTLGVEVDL